MALDIISLSIHVIINTIIISPVLWLAGRLMVGGKKARFIDAIWIVVLGTVIGALTGVIITKFFTPIIQLVLWLLLVKHFFDTGWLKAFIISVIAVIIFIIIVVALGLIGIALITLL